MAQHKIESAWEVEFEDGRKEILHFQPCYYFHSQKDKYLVIWLEELMKEKGITSKPLFIRDIEIVKECEEYPMVIGV